MTENDVRGIIDDERSLLKLDPLPPFEEEEDISTMLNRAFGMDEVSVLLICVCLLLTW